jgi:hypothetical protein
MRCRTAAAVLAAAVLPGRCDVVRPSRRRGRGIVPAGTAVLIVVALAALAAPGAFAQAPLLDPGLSTTSAGAPGVRTLLPERPAPTIATMPWYDDDAGDWNRRHSGLWNQEYRPWQGGIGLSGRVNTARLAERDGAAYLQGARMIAGLPHLTFTGVVAHGVRLRLNAGASQIQIKPAGDAEYDVYNFGYYVGGGIGVGLSLGRIGMVLFDVDMVTHENRTRDASNPNITASGQQVTSKLFRFSGDAALYIELFGSGRSDDVTLGLLAGAGVTFVDGTLETPTGDLRYELPNEQWFNIFGSVRLVIAHLVVIEARLRAWEDVVEYSGTITLLVTY